MSGVPQDGDNTPGIEDISQLAEAIGTAAVIAGDIANRTPGIRAAYRGLCNVWAGTPGGRALQLLDIENVCTPFWQQQGINPPGRGAARFSGGQCPGDLYRVTIDIDINGTVTNDDISDTGPGPVSVTEGQNEPQGNFFFFSFNGERSSLLNAGTTQVGNTVGFSDVRVENLTNPADNCGSEQGPFEPSDNFDAPGFGDPQVITDDNGRDWNITVGPPTVGDDGTISIPVEIDGVNFDIGTSVPGPSGGGFNPGPTSTGAAASPAPGGGLTPLPEAPSGARTVAVTIEMTQLPVGLGFVEGSQPLDSSFAVLGGAVCRMRDSGGGIHWTEEVLISQRVTTIAIPVEGLTIDAVRVTLNQAGSYTATPVYRSDTQQGE